MERLRAGWDALRGEIEMLSRSQAPDRAALGGLRDLVRAFRQETHSLLVTMLFEDAPPALTDAADELLSVFGEALARLDALLARARPAT